MAIPFNSFTTVLIFWDSQMSAIYITQMILGSVSRGCSSYGYLCNTLQIPMSSLSFCLLFHIGPGAITCHDVIIDGLIIIACSLLAILLLLQDSDIINQGLSFFIISTFLFQLVPSCLHLSAQLFVNKDLSSSRRTPLIFRNGLIDML